MSIEKQQPEKVYPDKCPITGRPFFMVLENESGEFVPTYGGPYYSYTIPVPDEDNEGWYSTDRYCHDMGCWTCESFEIEQPEQPKELTAEEAVEAFKRELVEKLEAYKDTCQQDEICGLFTAIEIITTKQKQ